jgi:hypothetical protein
MRPQEKQRLTHLHSIIAGVLHLAVLFSPICTLDFSRALSKKTIIGPVTISASPRTSFLWKYTLEPASPKIFH